MSDMNGLPTVEQLLRVGKPFAISMTIAASITDDSFVLASTDYDWNGDGTDETAPFASYSLVITAIELQIGSATGTNRLVIDDVEVYKTTVSGAATALYWDGSADTSNNLKNPNVTDIFGGPIFMRDSFTVKKSGAPSGTATTVIRGVAVPNRLV